MSNVKNYQSKERKSILEKGTDYIKSYFNLSSLLIFGSGATAGFAIGATSRLVVDIFDFLYNSGSYVVSNFPNYDLANSIKYASNALASAFPSAASEGARAAPMYGIGTLVFYRLVKRAIFSIFRKG
ncbi:MAG: hypothetical protein QXO57_03430 [Candidatus Aenigmatarchaeota archaeon]